jgi:ATP-dependent exoDNAse (exonuclease V) beta subunit
MQTLSFEAQNPYLSILVEASAGSGKTYQLSRRFLFLVASGSRPREILTVTFTVKAVGEMKARIIAEAASLLWSEKNQKEFDTTMEGFYGEAKTRYAGIPKPRTAKETASLILSSTQSLKISTIDSLFQEWVLRFPRESTQGQMAYPYRIWEESEKEDLLEEVWRDFFFHCKKVKGPKFVERLIGATWDGGALSLAQELGALDRYGELIWQSGGVFVPHPLPDLDPALIEEGALLDSLNQEFQTLIREGGSKEIFLLALGTRTLGALKEARLLTQEGTVSGVYFKGAKRDKLFYEIQEIESRIARWEAYHRLKKLNHRGALFMEAYRLWEELLGKAKKQKKLAGFSDLTRASYRLFTGEEGQGALWLLQKQIRHILIDEFQDTSLIQWQIFETLIREILSGQGASWQDAPGTSFVVGDRKQSIYGFRDADPYVMDLAHQTYRELGGTSIYLNESFRSTETVLDFVNHTFLDLFPGTFGRHSPSALGPPGLLENRSRIRGSQVYEETDDASPLENEARALAGWLKDVLDRPGEYPVYDKTIKGFRGMRPQDICILYRNSTHGDVFEEALEGAGIPVGREGKKGFLELPEIRDFLALLTYLVYPSQDSYLWHFLRSPLGGLGEVAVLDLITQGKVGLGETWSQKFETLIPLAQTHPPGVVAARTLEAFSLLSRAFLYGRGDERKGKTAQRNLVAFLEILPGLDAPSFGHLLQNLAQGGSQITSGSPENAVTMMTIHKAKGLEFPLVCLVEAYEPWFKVDPYWMKVPGEGVTYVGRKDEKPLGNLFFDQKMEQNDREMESESRRLLYVALTRASQFLWISGHKSKRKPLGDFYGVLHREFEKWDSGDGSWEKKMNLLPAPPLWEPSPGPEEKPPAEGISIGDSINKREIHLVHPSQTPSTPLAQGIEAYVKKQLEFQIKQKPFPGDFYWRLFIERQAHLYDLNLDKKIRETLEDGHPELLAFLGQGDVFHPEEALVHRSDHSLMRGGSDLMVHLPQGGFLLLDLKYGEDCDPSLAFCLDHGYDRKLSWYETSLRRMSTGPVLIKKGVWFISQKTGVLLESL